MSTCAALNRSVTGVGRLGQTTISGVVTSTETGERLPGVNITEKGTTRGAVTDVNGDFNMEVSDNATLVFSYVGFSVRTR